MQCTAFQFQSKLSSTQIAIIYSILTKTERYFSSVGGISTFKRYFNCILHAECSASRFLLRNKHSGKHFAIIYSILTKTERYFSSVGRISTSKRYFNCILPADCSASRFSLRNKHSGTHFLVIYSILTKTERYSSSVVGISTFKRYFNCILHAECSARRYWRRNRHSSQ